MFCSKERQTDKQREREREREREEGESGGKGGYFNLWLQKYDVNISIKCSLNY